MFPPPLPPRLLQLGGFCQSLGALGLLSLLQRVEEKSFEFRFPSGLGTTNPSVPQSDWCFLGKCTERSLKGII